MRVCRDRDRDRERERLCALMAVHSIRYLSWHLQIRAFVLEQLAAVNPEHLRLSNPKPYRVSISAALHEQLHRLWKAEMPASK
jgi:hypothetical protein